MSKPPTQKPHIHTPPEKRPLRSPPEPPQRHTPKPTQPEPHRSGGQTHRQPGFLPFSTIPGGRAKCRKSCGWRSLFCKKNFIKKFARRCEISPLFFLYICTEGTPHGTPERHRATEAAPEQDQRTPDNRSGGKAARTAARIPCQNKTVKARTPPPNVCKYHRHG